MSLRLHPSLRRLAVALPLAFACLASLPAAAADQEFERALKSYRTGHMSEAYGRFLELGRKGDPDAARIALFMGQYGTMLHSKTWELNEHDAAELRRTAARPSVRLMAQPEPSDYEGFNPKSARLSAEKLASQ